MAKKMLIDATHPEETRVVVMDGSRIDEFDFESLNKRQLAGNIYLAKVTRVEPSLQAAFVEYGGNRHGFLAFSEIHPDYYQIPVADREALMAAEAAAHAEEDDEPAEPKKAKSSRSRSRSRSRGRKNDDADTATQQDAAAGDKASSEADNAAPVEAAASAPSGMDVIDTPEADAAPANDVVAEAEPATTPAPEIETTPEADAEGARPDESDDTPKSIAESAGTDEDESVSEDIPDAAEAVKPSEEAVAEPAPAEAVEATEAGETPETAEGEAPPAEPKKSRSTRSPRKRSSGSRAKKASPEDADDNANGEADAKDSTDKPDTVGADRVEDEVRPRRLNHRRYKIQEVIKVRQIMLVQVVKEERGNKGAALTTYLSLAGRYCVLMPNTARGGGISRKITQAGDRKKLKEIAGELEVPKGMGLIIRTAGAQRTKTEIKRDYEFLLRQWEQVRDLTLQSSAPALIYEEGSLIKRSIRDLYGREIDEIIVEGENAYREAKDYMKMLMPSHAKNVQPHREGTPLFSKFSVESHLSAMFNPTVQLKSGGYIVIGITEALVAIDVNSGRSTREHSIEETALKTNLEASDEVARQLRLRDLAGLIVIDYIDMEDNRNNRAVEKRLKDRLQNDRARIQVGRISAFGLMEMSRQRLRPGMLEATTAPCAHCHGTGIVRSADNVALAILREVEEEAVRRSVREVKVIAPVAVANYIINQKRAHVASIEERYGIDVLLEGDATLISPDYKLEKVKGQARPPRQNHAPAAISAESAFEEEADNTSDDVEEQQPDRQQQNRNQNNRDDDGDNGEGGQKKSRRRGKRGGRRRGGRKDGENRNEDQTSDQNGDQTETSSQDEAKPATDPLGDVIDTSSEDAAATPDNVVDTGEETAQKPKRKRPAPRTKKAKEEAAAAEAPVEETTPEPEPEPEKVAAAEVATDAPADVIAEEPTPEPVKAPAEEVAEAAPEAPAEPEKPKKKRFGWWS